MSEASEGEPVIYRFADPNATETFEVPGCHCPAGIHKAETITYRTQLGAGEWEVSKSVGLAEGEGEYINFGASNTQAIVTSITEWSLLSKDPCYHPGKRHGKFEPLGISRRNVMLLDDTIRQAILERIVKAQAVFAGEVPEAEATATGPNGSGARSRASSRASASPTPTTPPLQ